MTSRTRVAKHRKRQDLRCEELDLGYLGKLWLPPHLHSKARDMLTELEELIEAKHEP